MAARRDLSSTSIAQLPTAGLYQLRTLIVTDTPTLKKIPSIYVFPMLEVAQLTYAYHCCSFQYPKTHDPSAHEEHLRLQAELNRRCANKRDGIRPISLQSPIASSPSNLSSSSSSTSSPSGQQSADEFEGYFDTEHQRLGIAGTVSGPPGANNLLSMIGQPPGSATQAEPNINFNLWLMHFVECGELTMKYSGYPNITCTPAPDAFNPCEDIMGYSVLRIGVWFVVGASSFGNMSVIVVLGSVFNRLSVPKFLQLNLAIGDLFMGIYLAMLALADLTTVGAYFNYANDWQHGYGCMVAGAFSLFASQLSIFTLCVITFERYYTITYSIDLNMRLQLSWASRIMVLGWLFAFASAMLPIFADVSSYAKTSICLPLRTSTTADRVFLATLLLIDTIAFIIIFACYLRMYLLIIRQKTEATAKERTIAMRMALLVFTDFACWAPIIFFGATALAGKPLISVTNSKILIVFFYPLNSMANPFLYVLTTHQYQRDLRYLTSRWHMWRKNLFSWGADPDDLYYPGGHNYGGNPALLYQGNALNAHLEAVAAVTAIAQNRELRCVPPPSPLLAPASQLSPAAAAVLGGRRYVCTNKGRYIVRHQILTDGQTPGRPPRRATHAAYPLRSLASPGRAASAGRSRAPEVERSLPQRQAVGGGGGNSGGGGGSGGSKQVNLSEGGVTSAGAKAIEYRLNTSDDTSSSGVGGAGARPGADDHLQPGYGRRISICGERLVERCSCCCSKSASHCSRTDRRRLQQRQQQRQTPEAWGARRPEVGLAGQAEATTNNSQEMKSQVTLITSLLNTTATPNQSDQSNEPPVPSVVDGATKEANGTNCTKRALRRKCSCLAVDDIFKDALVETTTCRRSPCLAHGGGGSDGARTPDIDILGNISYNEPSSSTTQQSGLCSPAEDNHQPHRVARSGGKCRRVCDRCRQDRRRHHLAKSRGSQDDEGEKSGLANGTSHLSSVDSATELQLTSSASSSREHHLCRYHLQHHHHHRRRHQHQRHENCDNDNHHHSYTHHHHHHHHHKHCRHRRRHQLKHLCSKHRHRYDADQLDDIEQAEQRQQPKKIELEMSGRRRTSDGSSVIELTTTTTNDNNNNNVDNGSELEAKALRPSSGEAGFSFGIVSDTHTRLESILKPSSSGLMANNGGGGSGGGGGGGGGGGSGAGGRWSPMINLLRGGSFHSKASARGNKKRVSIIEHYSG